MGEAREKALRVLGDALSPSSLAGCAGGVVIVAQSRGCANKDAWPCRSSF